MGITLRSGDTRLSGRSSLLFFTLCAAPCLLCAQNMPSTAAPQSAVPAWAQPGSPTHKQAPPPADFPTPSRNFDTPIGLFEGQSAIGSAVVPGSANYDATT